MLENSVFQKILKYGIGYWNCLFSGYISRRIYKIINVLMQSHKKDYIQAYVDLFKKREFTTLFTYSSF